MNLRTELDALTNEEKLFVKRMLEDEIFYKEVENQIYAHPQVPILQFIEDKQYLGRGEEVWPKIKEDLHRIKDGGYKQVIYVGGIGAGKTTEIALLLTYEIFELGRLRNPQRFYGLRTGSRIAAMNMSIRATQARDVLFDDMKAFADESPWFQKYMRPDPKIRSRLRFRNNIFAIPGNSQETFPIGFNVKVAALDESAWFMTASHVGDSTDPSENVYNSLLKRLKSRFDDYLLAVLTSPRKTEDMTEKMRDEAINNPEILWVKRPLWKAKPKGFYSNQFFVYDEQYGRIVCKDVRDLIREGFGHVPDGFEVLKIEEIQYLINLLLSAKPGIKVPNVIDETESVLKPEQIDLEPLNTWRVASAEGVADIESETASLEDDYIPTLTII